MILIIGLGNPGEKYKNNRHNAGFIVIDEIKKLQNFPDLEFSKKFNSEISEGTLIPILPIQGEGARRADEGEKKEALFIKPNAFMNNSGEAVRKILDFYKLTPRDIIVIHDDLDIEIGNYKISSDISSAGHKGVQDIMDRLGTQEFKRVRIGVETAGGRQNRNIPGEDYVLQDFSEEEIEKIKFLAVNIIDEIKKETEKNQN